MPLASGTRLGPYEILAPLGAGGMGEVYRAKDTRLDRTVAVKVLATHLASDPDLKQRLEREAKAISALQHPNICTLHDIGSENNIDFLVMELLEGQTLAERLAKGQFPLAQAVTVGIEIAQALQKAHAHGLIHRDLKPGNIMLTKSGAKLMDFGLAKPAVVMPARREGSLATSAGTLDVTALVSPASPITQKGAIVGTFQYIAPEVLQGCEADARSDIFSFGCVLYEMLTGKKAFDAKSQLGVLSAILEKDPEPIRISNPLVPTALDRIVLACLAKDPADRIQSAHDVELALRWSTDAAPTGASGSPKFSRKRFAGAIAIATALIFVAAICGYWWAASRPAESLHTEISAPDNFAFSSTGDSGGMPILSPQGDKIAFVARSKDAKTLWVRSLNSDSAQQLEGTQGAMHPFWSPDGKYIGFFSNGKLRKIAISGGSPAPLADVSNPRGGSWGKNDIILYTPNIVEGILQVSANGGAATPATEIDRSKEDTQRWPWFMPDGKHYIFLAVSHMSLDPSKQGIYFASLDSKETHFVVSSASGAQYVAGYLLYRLNADLVAQPFDPEKGTLSGHPVTLLSNVRNDSGIWRSVFSAASNGRLIYQNGSADLWGTQLFWFDRNGKQLEAVSERGPAIFDVRLSPDGKRAALGKTNGIWVIDLERKTQTRVTFDEQLARQPSWSPDGKSVVFSISLATGGNAAEVRMKAADGSGQEKTLAKTTGQRVEPTFSPDGKYLVYGSYAPPYLGSLWVASSSGENQRVLLQPPTAQSEIAQARISHDSRWIAYLSSESGQQEIYISRFPQGAGKWRVSTDSGAWPMWTANDKEIFYKDFNDNFWICPVHIHGDDLDVGTPRQLFHVPQPGLGVPFDLSPDGQRVLVNVSEEEANSPLKIMTSWLSELKQ